MLFSNIIFLQVFKGYILTFEGKETITFDDGSVVEVIPVWEWMLQ